MKGFIAHIAESLYKEYGDDVSSLNLVFPSRRARLFFADALSQVSGKPMWQPNYLTIDDIMGQLSGLTRGEDIKLIAELYKVYSKYHNEKFDSFYFWGEMLLSDFDSVDKYMIDADMLFSNVSDLKQIENDLSYLSQEQIEVIRQFWNTFAVQSGFSAEQEQFLKVWQTLAPIYKEFRAAIEELGIAYTGMIYRRAAENVKAGIAPQLVAPSDRYVVAGFNALTKCENVVLDHLSKNYETRFFWDYDDYYISDRHQEAGLFLRDNIRRFPQKTAEWGTENFAAEKELTIIAAPSDAMQCRYVNTFLSELNAPDKETAVVLTDENLLMPVLYSVPESVENVNITMGYPLRQTLEYSFVERLIELQSRKRSRLGQAAFYHNDVNGLLSHPFVAELCGATAAELHEQTKRRSQIFVNSSHLCGEPLIEKIFCATDSWQEQSQYILAVISEVAGRSNDQSGQRREFLAIIAEHIHKLKNSLEDCDIEMSVPIFTSLLRRTLQVVRVPYEGEPLLGVQVMGILETRNLDFENVVILSMTDDTFPGNRSASSSFIPYNLRMAYGLPTPAHHEGVYAYYFYRLIQRAKKVHLVYSSRSDDKHSGEPSRYIHQLRYESPHKIVDRSLDIDINLRPSEPIVIEKSGEVLDRLKEFIEKPERTLSPTTFYSYLECPLKFCFKGVLGLRKEDELVEQIDSPMFGNILHYAMEKLYEGMIGMADPRGAIRKLIGSDAVNDAVRGAITKKYLKGEELPEEEYVGNVLLVRDIVTRYINNCLLPYDAGGDRFEMVKLEAKVAVPFSVEWGGVPREVHFAGVADRIDKLADGTIRVVDYKTGSVHLEFDGVESLFDRESKKSYGAVFQTMLYAMMINREQGVDVCPALYYVRKISAKNYSPLLDDKGSKTKVSSYINYRNEFERGLTQVLAELFDLSVPFTQCSDTKQCEWCDYRKICNR